MQTNDILPCPVCGCERAALSVEAQPVAVKPLEWKSFAPGDGSGFATTAFVADGIFGIRYTVLLSLRSGNWSFAGEDYGSEEAAKAAAQADYVARIRSALATTPAPTSSEPVYVPDGWMFRDNYGDLWRYSEQEPEICFEKVRLASYSAPAPTPAGEGWRTMETAPKDGTVVYLWNEKTKSILRNVRWVVEEREGNQHPTCILDGWKTADMNAWACFVPDTFTHWMMPWEIPCPCGSAAPTPPEGAAQNEERNDG